MYCEARFAVYLFRLKRMLKKEDARQDDGLEDAQPGLALEPYGSAELRDSRDTMTPAPALK
jgi:hypothetical protein